MKQLVENELSYRLMVEASPNALILVNNKGEIVYLNRFAEKLFQYSRNEILGEKISILIPFQFKSKHPSFMHNYYSSPVSRQMGANKELYGLKKNGDEFSIEIGLNPIETPQGIQVLASIIDITERKKYEKKFRLVVESAPNSLILVNRDGKIIIVNQETLRQFGYAKEELEGKQLEKLIPERFRGKHKFYRTAYADKPEKRSMGMGRDLFALQKNGEEFPAEIGLNPIESEDEMLILASVIDITERKKHENELIQTNKKLTELTEVLDFKNKELERKNNSIKESIEYAEKIQYSILPDLTQMKNYFSKFVLYFEPKDKIGGDFYWFHHKENISYVAVIDCTGHSVPGALMSLIINSLLNEIIYEKQDISTGEVLGELHKKLYQHLKQSKGDLYSQDGCDLSLCAINYKTKQIQYSGAHQHLYILRNNRIEIIKATSRSIGGFCLVGRSDSERTFETHTIDIDEKMTFAMTSDGILDQLNEEDDVFGTKRFIELVAQNSHLHEEEMDDKIKDTIKQWKDNTIQLDDMLMIAFNLKN